MFKEVTTPYGNPFGAAGKRTPKTKKFLRDLAKTVREWLEAGELTDVVIERQWGRSGMTPALQFQTEPRGDDVEGKTVKDVDPDAFVEFLYTRIIEMVSEEPGKTPIRVVGYHLPVDDDGEIIDDQAERLFQESVSYSVIKEALPPDTDITISDGYEGLVEGYKRFAELHMAHTEKFASLAEKAFSAGPDLLHAHSESLLGLARMRAEEQPSSDLELAKLKIEMDLRMEEIRSRHRHNRQERTAQMVKHLIDVIGPDAAKAFAEYMARNAGGDESEPTQEASSLLALVRSLDISDEQIRRARTLLGSDAGLVDGLVDAITQAKAADDSATAQQQREAEAQVKASVLALMHYIKARKELLAELLPIFGPQNARLLGAILMMVRKS